MSKCKFVEVVDMGYTEIKRSGENEGGRGGKGSDEKVERYEQGAEEEFFACGTGDEVAPADPAA